MSDIYADEAHCHLRSSHNSEPAAYTVRASSKITIDLTGYDWLYRQVLRETEEGDVAIHVMGSGRYYLGQWPKGRSKLTVDSKCLMPAKTYPEFPGFISGDWVIAIGRERTVDDSSMFTPLWLGLLKIVAVN